MIIMQHEAERLAVAHKDSSKVSTPKDLAGKTFGGYGVPMEKALNDTMIKAAGGDSDYKTVTLGPSVYNSLQSGQVDWAIPYATDDIAWAQMEGTPWKTFSPTDYGVPDFYDKLVFTSSDYADAHPDVTKKFVAALHKGYEYAMADPAKAIGTQAKLVNGAFDVPQQTKTAQLLASDYWPTADKQIGPSDAAVWTKVGQFLVAQKILKGSNGKALTSLPDVSGWFTNEYLPAS
jgi:ABC-type nitrate/sulfonate/bicarbonate transport system substrate-binding protein